MSHDRKHVLLAVGQATQDRDLDFVIYHIETKKATTLSKKLMGQVPDSEISSAKIPVQFQDDGTYVYTYMYNKQIQGMAEYRYSWSSGLFETWKSPVNDNAWNGFISNDDGSYRYYYNGGWYRGSEKIDLPDHLYPNFWLHGTNSFVYSKAADNSPNPSKTLEIYNVDNNKSRTIVKLPPGDYSLVGGSSDGRWIYIFTSNNLFHTDLTP
ncbi:hypothetical protein D3C73_1152910 [compost metagenome]